MASSGFVTGSYHGYTLNARWSAKQDVAGNFSDVTVVHELSIASGYPLSISAKSNNCSVDGVVHSYTSPAIDQKGGTVALGTTVHRVYHNANGSKSCTLADTFNINATIDGVRVGKITASATISLDSIPRYATIVSAEDFADTADPSLKFANPAGYTCSASLEFAGKEIARDGAISSAEGTYTFSLTDSERSMLLAASPNSDTTAVTYVLTTSIGGTAYTSKAVRTLTITDCNPVPGAVSYRDTDKKTVAVTGDSRKIVQGQSAMEVAFGAAKAVKGASITGYTVSFAGKSQKVTSAGTVNLGTVSAFASQALTVTATDSRGHSASASVTVTVEDYSAPTAVIDLNRLNNFEPGTHLTVSARYSYLNGKNAVTISAKFKKVSDSAYGAPIALTNSVQSTVTCDRDSAYDFVVTIADKLESTDYNLTLGKGIPAFFIDTKKSSVGVNCLPSQSDVLQLGESAWLTAQGAYPVGAIYLSVTEVDPSALFGGTWERIGGRFLLGADSTYAAGSTGGEAARTPTVDEMSKRNHEIDNLNASGNATPSMTVQAHDKKGSGGNVQTMYAGGSKAHNDLPPYLAVYMWQRVS